MKDNSMYLVYETETRSCIFLSTIDLQWGVNFRLICINLYTFISTIVFNLIRCSDVGDISYFNDLLLVESLYLLTPVYVQYEQRGCF